jgi:hypothetical protein
MIRKVANLTSLSHDVVLLLLILFFWIYIDLDAKVEAANKALAEEKSSRQVADQALQAT